MIEDKIEYGTVDISIVISSKSSEFSLANCGYVVAPNFFYFSELLKLFTTVHQVTPSA